MENTIYMYMYIRLHLLLSHISSESHNWL